MSKGKEEKKATETEDLYLGPDFKVRLMPDLELEWEVDPEKEVTTEVHSLLASAKVIDALPTPKVSIEQVRSWKLMIGHAVTLALIGELDKAKVALKEGEEFITARATEVAKGWYVTAALTVITVLMIASAAIGYNKNRMDQNVPTEAERILIEDNLKEAKSRLKGITLEASMVKEPTKTELEKMRGEAQEKVLNLQQEREDFDTRRAVSASLGSFQIVALTLLGGALGAAFSLLTRLGRIGVDPASGKKAHYIEVIFRITVGVLAAGVIVIAMKANLVLGFASADETDAQGWMLLMLAIAAGYSERMVPSVLRQVESSVTQPDEDE